MLTWNQSLKMKYLKKRGEIYYQWNHESIYVINFVSHKNDFDDLNLKWVLSKSWLWFVKLNELKMNDDFSLEWLWPVFLVFMIWFFVFMKGLSHHPIIFFLILLMWWYEYIKYSLIYFDVYKWKVMIMHGRI